MANNIMAVYNAAPSAMTITLASLANDSTNLLVGRESTVVDNSSNLYPDYHVTGRVTTGTGPTSGNTIEVWAYGNVSDAPLYPGGITGSNAGITFTSLNVKRNALRPVARITVDSNSDRSYDFAEVSIARLFNGVPKYWGIVVVNGSGAALNSTSGNHYIYMKPIGFQIV